MSPGELRIICCPSCGRAAQAIFTSAAGESTELPIMLVAVATEEKKPRVLLHAGVAFEDVARVLEVPEEGLENLRAKYPHGVLAPRDPRRMVG